MSFFANQPASNIYKQNNYSQPTYRTPANPDPNKMYAQGMSTPTPMPVLGRPVPRGQTDAQFYAPQAQNTTNQSGWYAPQQTDVAPQSNQYSAPSYRNDPNLYGPWADQGSSQAVSANYGRNNIGNPPPYRPPASPTNPSNPYQTPGMFDAYNDRNGIPSTPITPAPIPPRGGSPESYGFTSPPAGSMYTQAYVTWKNSRTGEAFQAPTGGWKPPNGDWTSGGTSTPAPITPIPTQNTGTRPPAGYVPTPNPVPVINPIGSGTTPAPGNNYPQPTPTTPAPITPAPTTPSGVQPSYVTPVPGSAFGTNFTGGIPQIGAAADRERQESARRNAERANFITSGYDQQIANSRRMSEADYTQSQNDYAGITGDAMATRARNMGRIDQYGQSARNDLNIKNQQALAAASQSAINRGLGNTTIQDSLRRGQNFDNNRQMMNLDDQLLQNRISTDSSLSNAYQDTLQTRAQFLANQRAQRMANERDAQNRQLQFIEGINDEGPSFNDVSNYYMQATALRG